MCGIVGVASRLPISRRDQLVTQCDTLTHRGPDDTGTWWSPDGVVGLAHRRLAIIDLSPAGHQPMSDESGDLCIVFNGEIYNFKELRFRLQNCGHRFRSESDTEVILAAYHEWGVECLHHFNGMFAFALYDQARRRLFVARDRAGEKPLFYHLANETFAFASELKALMADPVFPRRINPEALDCYLAFGYVPGEYCILDGVKKLPPAHALTFDLHNGQLRFWRYWKLPATSEGQYDAQAANEATLQEELEHLLEDAVRRQLVADVPVGILLSGGIDSSLITAMAARVAASVKTYTIRFPGHPKYDETEHARLISRYFGTEHTELDAESSTVELLPMLARQYDEPIVDSSMIPTYLVSKLVRQHCTVAMGGDGGDELFGGYAHYNLLLRMQKNFGWTPGFFRDAIAGLATKLLPLGSRGRNWLQTLGTDLDVGTPLIATYFDVDARLSLLKADFISQSASVGSAERILERHSHGPGDLLQRAMRMDFENFLPEDILVKLDRASMLNSLEVRAPFLDYRIIEFAFHKVPSHLKATLRSRKILPKLLAAKLLPRGFDLERKQGFSIPLSSWLRDPEWNDYFRQVLLDSSGTPFNRPFVQKLLDNQARGYSNSDRLFALLLLELWRQEYKVTL
ncbi:MAG: asparagine synthase (glutamine-hydrolyzing) [Syntrophobacteraceae bacterium]|jgi:asparagine synthase (glutamine-hydrolysing)